MTKLIKVSEASGLVLDYLVLKSDLPLMREQLLVLNVTLGSYNPSTDYNVGGQIIARAGITVRCIGRSTNGFLWDASTYGKDEEIEGRTALIAAMRCYVTSKLGQEVEVPGDLA